jgi:3-oxoacyl-[acyl-carrier-protein] synthase-3
VLQDVAGVNERRLWDGDMLPSDAATLAGVKALADAGIDADRVGLLVNTSVSRDYLEPSTASIVSGNLRLARTARTSTSPTPASPSSTAWTSPAA